jgi:tetratricopeptide (TPR) repeat protein
MEPENSDYRNLLAYLLIDKDININEGMELVESALRQHPDNYNYFHTRSWGLYKQGNSKEALALIQKSWDLKPYYDHTLFLHLKEVKKSLPALK